MGKHRRSFTPEFKQEAVDLVRRSGKSGCQVARELGIAQPTLNRWIRWSRLKWAGVRWS